MLHEVSRQSSNSTLAPSPISQKQEGPHPERRLIKLIPKVISFFSINTAQPNAFNRKIRFGRIDEDPSKIYALIYILTPGKKWTCCEKVSGDKIKISGPLPEGSEQKQGVLFLNMVDAVTQNQILNNLRPPAGASQDDLDQDQTMWSVLPTSQLELTSDMTTGEKSAKLVTSEILLMRQYA